MPPSRYSPVARILHWVIAVLVIAQLVLGYVTNAAEGAAAEALLSRHVQIGVLVLALMLLRILARIAYPPPPLPAQLPQPQRVTARVVHLMLYSLLLVLPVSGYVLWAWMGNPLDWFGVFPIPILFTGGEDETWRSIAGYTHICAGYLLAVLLALHIGAALWHEFVLRDRLIRDRML